MLLGNVININHRFNQIYQKIHEVRRTFFQQTQWQYFCLKLPIGGFMNITISTKDLAQLLPKTEESQLATYAPILQQYCPQYTVNTPLRWCHFIAQLAHESGALTRTQENLNYSSKALRTIFTKYFPNINLAEQYQRQPERIANRVYANRMGNHDEASGDGWKYRGRGLIQLTGRANYQALTIELGEDVVNQPERLADEPTLAVKSALWFWQKNNLSALADVDQLEAITKRINGGLNGLAERAHYLQQAKNIFITT